MITYIIRVFSDGQVAVHEMRNGYEQKVTFMHELPLLPNASIQYRDYPLG